MPGHDRKARPTYGKRLEDRSLTTGRGRYIADLCPPNTLYCAFIRSPIAHGDLIEIDVGEAVNLPGVVGIFDAADLNLKPIPAQNGWIGRHTDMPRPPLVQSRIRYMGEPLAVVVANSQTAAVDAAHLVRPEIEELKPITSPEESLSDGTLLFDQHGTNSVAHLHFDEGEPPTEPPTMTTTVTVESPRLMPAPIEPLAVLAAPSSEGLRLWCGHQAPHRLRDQVASLLDLDPGHLRVSVPDVGGAFGTKGMLYPEYLVVAELCRRLGLPVAWLQTRREMMSGGTHGRGMRHRVTLCGTESGRITEARIDVLADVGAYPHNGSQIPLFARLVATGLYDIPKVEIETRIVVTNTAPTGSYRGAGRPEAALAIERAIDAFARSNDLDPFEVRLQNMIQSSQLPYRTPTGAVYDSGDYRAALHLAMAQLDLRALEAEKLRRSNTGRALLGVGVGAFVERAGGAVDSGEYGGVEIDSDQRRIIVRTGSTDTGQGHLTVWSRLVDRIFELQGSVVLAGDTEHVAQGVGTFGSRSAQIGASAVSRTARQVLSEATQRASERLEAAEHDIRYHRGTFSVAGSPGTEISIWELARDRPLAAEEFFVPGAQTFPYGVHAAVVEVDVDTGEVRVLRIVAVDDCGEVLDPVLVDGQLIGSLTQGWGSAMIEGVSYDAAGQLLSATFMDYLMPRAGDIPPIATARLTHPAPSNPLGAKGAGESGCIGLPPAILNATIDALAPLGVTDLQIPLTPANVWESINQALQNRR